MFFSNNLSDIDHCFFSKLGGNSKKIYSSLNCGMGSSDNKTHVKKNLSHISRYYELSSKSLITMYQTHSTKCKVISYVAFLWKLLEKKYCLSVFLTILGP